MSAGDLLLHAADRVSAADVHLKLRPAQFFVSAERKEPPLHRCTAEDETPNFTLGRARELLPQGSER